MKFISWNVNGIRACIKKGFLEFFNKAKADFFCIQETKIQENQVDIKLPGYFQYWNYAQRKGYSGTAIFTKYEPLCVNYGIGESKHDSEGRVITLEMEEFYLVNVYTPNSKDKLLRLDYRMEWEDSFREYVIKLEEKKPVIICGDLNVSHCEIDLKNPKNNHHNPGFTDEERGKLDLLLKSGFVDTYRELYPEDVKYSWWSYRFHARERNAGWRIDYFIMSEKLKSKITDAKILNEVFGSDHCPVYLSLKD